MYGFSLKIKGDYALFSRPEMKVERVSYDVPTPSALVGLISSIYWHPGVKYVIDRIYVYKPVNFVNIRRNELSEKIKLGAIRGQIVGKEDATVYSSDLRTQRASLILKNVEYGVRFHFELDSSADETMTDEKCYNILLRRLKKGQFFQQPCLGCREFPASVDLADELPPSSLKGDVDLGYMLYGLRYTKDVKGKYSDFAEPQFYRPHMVDGIIDVQKYAKELIC